jgi:hypothetical protein
MSEHKFNAASGDTRDEGLPSAPERRAEEADEAALGRAECDGAVPASDAAGDGFFGDISDEELLKEMLDAEEAAGLFQGAAPDGGESEPLPGARAAGGVAAELEAKLAEAEKQLAEAREQLMRKAADFENFRKRMNQEKQRAIEFANESLLLDIIPVIDDFERAIQSAQAVPDLADVPAGKAMLDGLLMIEKKAHGPA